MSLARRFGLALVFVLAGPALAALVTAQQPAPARPVIVVFNDDVSFDGFRAEYRETADMQAAADAWGYLDRGVVGAMQTLERGYRFRATQAYSAAIRGFAATLTDEQIQAIRQNPLVRYVEDDNVMRAVAQTLPWGINRVDADVSSALAGNGSGTVTGVRVFVIDTGADVTHPDLRVVYHVNFTGSFGGGNTDCHGHGTHVSGTAAARDNTTHVVGVAPGAAIIGVKVLNCSGSGFTSTVIKGVDWVTAYAPLPAVANMSLGGPPSAALDGAIVNSAASGVVYALAAGNSGGNACNESPSRTGPTAGVISVGATDINENEAVFSNFGNCVDIWAPGVDVQSTYLGGGTATMSGTSMASPHVAGSAALYLSLNPAATPADVEAAIKGVAQVTGTVSKDGRAIERLWVGSF